MAISNAALREKFSAFRRTAWKPVIADGTATVTGSKYYGIPLLKKDEQWPVCGSCGNALQLFLQLNISTLPPEAQSLLGLPSGILQMFYCTTDGGTDAEGWAPFSPAHLLRVLAEGQGDPTNPVAMPALLAEDGADHFPEKVITGWTAFTDFPSLEEDIELPDLDDAVYDAYYMSEPFLNNDEDKLGGWPDWVQGEEYPECPQCAAKMQLVYQLSDNAGASWMWGDAGIGHITQCPQHRDVLAFGWACS